MSKPLAIAQEVFQQLQEAGFDVTLGISTVEGTHKYTLTFSSAKEKQVVKSNVRTEKSSVLLTPPQKEILVKLKKLRQLLAEKQTVSCFIIAWNSLLEEIIVKNPTNMKELAAVKGVGPSKLASFGTYILGVLQGMEPEEAMNLPTEEPETVVQLTKKPEVELSTWKPSVQLINYYKRGNTVGPNSRFGKWCVLMGYKPEDVVNGHIPDAIG